MGYRSTVVAAIHTSVDVPGFPIVKEADLDYHVDEYRYLVWRDKKWYYRYDNVKEFMDWTDELDGSLYFIVNEGDDIDDITSDGSAWEAGIWREVTFPLPEVKDYRNEVIIGLSLVLIIQALVNILGG